MAITTLRNITGLELCLRREITTQGLGPPEGFLVANANGQQLFVPIINADVGRYRHGEVDAHRNFLKVVLLQVVM